MTRRDGLVPRKLAELTPENLRILMEDIGHGPGWYTSSDLYNWYRSMAEEDGLEAVSKKMFGMVLGRLGYRNATRLVGGKTARCWFITKKALRETPS
jgi:hypothetical protein